MRSPDIGPLHTIDTGNGTAHVRVEDIQAIVTTGLNQCSIVLRGGAALQVMKPTKDVCAALLGDAPEPPKLKLAT